MHVKWSVILADRLGPEILTMLEIKGLVLHRVGVHLKVPGWLSDLKSLLTRKLPMFLSRLNEISGGREKMCLVSGSLRRILNWSSKEELDQFITAVNSFHPALKYIWEISENSLAFLDIKISRNGKSLSTSVHYKPTDCHNYYYIRPLIHNT